MGMVLMIIGGIVVLIGYIQAVIAGFQRETMWGVLNLLFSPFTPAIMAIQGQMSWRPVWFMMIGGFLFVVGPLIFTAEMMGGIGH